MNKLQSALAWAARGFRVFPLREGTKDQPIFDKFSERATSDPALITQWWSDPFTQYVRDYNIGVDTSDLCVIDLDMKDGRDGVGSFQALGGTFEALTVQTPSGGYHVYTTPPAPVASTVEAIAPGIDLRGWHGYVLAPGSEIGGRFYQLVVDGAVTPTPPAIVERAQPPGRRASTVSTVELDTPSAIAQARSYLERAPGAPQGARNDTAFRLAAYLRDLGVTEATAKDLLIGLWNIRCEPPEEPLALAATVENAYAYAQNAAGTKSPAAYFTGVDVSQAVALGDPGRPTLSGVPASALPVFGNLLALDTLSPRPWILRRMLLAGETTVLIAPGGVGKSTMIYGMAVALARGADFWGFRNARVGTPGGSVIYNAEDSLEEMSMSLHALCQAQGVDVAEVAPWLMLISGRTHRKLVLADVDERRQPRYNVEDCKWLRSVCEQPGVVMCSLDPLVKLHRLDEFSNDHMSYLFDGLAAIGDLAKVGMVVAHHIAKPPFGASGMYAGNADAARGAGTIKDSARVCFTLAGPTEEDCRRYGLDTPDARGRHLRLDDAKMNRTLQNGTPTWIEKQSHRLWTGEEVGVFVPADMQDKLGEQRSAAANALEAELHARSTGALTLPEAALALQKTDPVWNLFTPAIARSRLERLLTVPATAQSGQRLGLVLQGSQKRIAFLE